MAKQFAKSVRECGSCGSTLTHVRYKGTKESCKKCRDVRRKKGPKKG